MAKLVSASQTNFRRYTGAAKLVSAVSTVVSHAGAAKLVLAIFRFSYYHLIFNLKPGDNPKPV
jgi:UDP-N-acetylglucosamine transferase subunit ALG13